MRSTFAIRFAAAVSLTMALSALPSVLPAAVPRHAAVAVQIAGDYKLTLVTGHSQQRMGLIVEEGETGYSGVLLTAGGKIALTNVEIIEETLHASVMTSAGPGRIVLYVTDKGVTGTMRVARVTFALSGERAN